MTGDWLKVVLSPHGRWTAHQLTLLAVYLKAPPDARLSWYLDRLIPVALAARVEDLPYEPPYEIHKAPR